MEIMSFTNTDNFIEKDHSFFPMRSCPLQIQIILLPFLLDIFCSFPCPVALIQIRTTVLNKMVRVDIPISSLVSGEDFHTP